MYIYIYASEIRSNNVLIFTLKICHLLCTHLLFEIVRARMKTAVEGDEHLDFCTIEALEQRRIVIDTRKSRLLLP